MILRNATFLYVSSYMIQNKHNINDFDLEAALVNNTELFNPEFLDPLKRSASSRATTQCGCGYAPAAGRIVAGQEVNPMHSRPYQVYLQSCSSKGCAMCGATLLNKRYAMTAMHCVTDATNLVVSKTRNRFISYLEM